MMQKILTAKGLKYFYTPKNGINAGIRKSSIEQIIIYEEGYPIAMVHIDLFYGKGKSETWSKLNEGEEVEFKIEFE